MTLEDVKYIVETYEWYQNHYHELYITFAYDEEQTGIPNPYEKIGKNDICKDVLRAYNRMKKLSKKL